MVADPRRITCPHCGERFDEHMWFSGEDHEPNIGDYTVCFQCTMISRFNDQGVWKPIMPHDHEDQALVDTPMAAILAAMIATIKEFKEEQRQSHQET